MKCIILAGGYGTRLAEETKIKPKPLVKIGSKPPPAKLLNVNVGVDFSIVTSPPKVASQPYDMSKVSAVIVEPPSFPLNIMSLSDTVDLIIKSSLESSSFAKVDPLFWRLIVEPDKFKTPPGSKLISPSAEILKLPLWAKFKLNSAQS